MHNLHTKKYNLIPTSVVTKHLLQSFLTASLLCCSACGDEKISMQEVEEIKEKTQTLEEENKTLKDKVTTLENNQPTPSDATTVAANLKKITDVLGENAEKAASQEDLGKIAGTLGIKSDLTTLDNNGIIPGINKNIKDIGLTPNEPGKVNVGSLVYKVNENVKKAALSIKELKTKISNLETEIETLKTTE